MRRNFLIPFINHNSPGSSFGTLQILIGGISRRKNRLQAPPLHRSIVQTISDFKKPWNASQTPEIRNIYLKKSALVVLFLSPFSVLIVCFCFSSLTQLYRVWSRKFGSQHFEVVWDHSGICGKRPFSTVFFATQVASTRASWLKAASESAAEEEEEEEEEAVAAAAWTGRRRYRTVASCWPRCAASFRSTRAACARARCAARSTPTLSARPCASRCSATSCTTPRRWWWRRRRRRRRRRPRPQPPATPVSVPSIRPSTRTKRSTSTPGRKATPWPLYLLLRFVWFAFFS